MSISVSPSRWLARVFFIHGNGFPSGSYAPFLRSLHPQRLRYVPLIGHNMPPQKKQSYPSWKQLIDQQIKALQLGGCKEPYVGIGHSMGANLLLAAYAKHPSAFSALVLMDPPILARKRRWGLSLLQRLGMAEKVIPPARKAKTRRSHWPSRQDAAKHLFSRSLFSRFPQDAKDAYLRHGIKDCANEQKGVQLAFDPKLEYHFYIHAPVRHPLRIKEIPVLVMYSSEYEVLRVTDVYYLRHRLLGAQFIPIPAGHMFPMEQPELTAHLIRHFLVMASR